MKRYFFRMLNALTLSGFAAVAAEQTWTGQISDSMCGADHSMMEHGGKKVSARDCTLACVKGGSKYVLVSKRKVFEVQNQELPELEKHAGHTVRVSGELQPDAKTIRVSKIAMTGARK